jgi:hypothetical protein
VPGSEEKIFLFEFFSNLFYFIIFPLKNFLKITKKILLFFLTIKMTIKDNNLFFFFILTQQIIFYLILSYPLPFPNQFSPFNFQPFLQQNHGFRMLSNRNNNYFGNFGFGQQQEREAFIRGNKMPTSLEGIIEQQQKLNYNLYNNQYRQMPQSSSFFHYVI